MRRLFSFNLFVYACAVLSAAVTVACAAMGGFWAMFMGLCLTYTIIVCKD